MSVAQVLSRAQIGLHAPPVHVEVNLGPGLPLFTIVGLPTKAVKESKERVRAALLNSEFEFPAGRITVNLAPADLPKEGGRFDLPIALGILFASGQLGDASSNAAEAFARQEFYGELGLAGELKPVKGVFLAAARAAQAGHEIVVPVANAEEAVMAARAGVRSAGHLLEVCAHLRGAEPLPVRAVEAGCASSGESPSLGASASGEPDLRDVRGQTQAKRALVIAAAGGHSLLMIGPPGSGKSMLAKRLPGLLPPLSEAEAIEAATIASVSASGFDARQFRRPPCRAPHHTASAHAIVGGGPHARPGEISLAHHGVLFLDELPEFDRRVLESLREPLETGSIAVSRARLHAEYPARFQLVAAMNPCPCGYLGDPDGACRCTPPQILRYRSKISGPLLDRIDMQIEVMRVPVHELSVEYGAELGGARRGDAVHGAGTGESTASAALRVQRARARQLDRAGCLNSALGARELRAFACITDAARRLLDESLSQLRLTARSYHRVLAIALTIADLADSDRIEASHLAEAVQLRRGMDSFDRATETLEHSARTQPVT